MYSHKRSFTGQSSRSLSALFDTSFLIGATLLTAIFSIAHSAVTYSKLESNIGTLPQALTKLSQETLIDGLKMSTSNLDPNLIFATSFGLLLPLILISVAVRWTLGSLRVSVQRSVTLCCLFIYYFCSFMTVALHNPEWTPGNILVRIFHSTGEQFFESLRAILCITLGGACVFTLARNATSKLNRSIRLTTAAAIIISILMMDYVNSKQTRTIHESYFTPSSNVNFIFIVPGLTTEKMRVALSDSQMVELKEQLTSFQEIHPSTPSLLGQFVTSVLGIEPNAHGIRHDFLDEEIVALFKTSLQRKMLAGSNDIHATALGGPTPLATLFNKEIPGARCGQELNQIAKLGHFQASVIPYSLSPRFFEHYLHPELICSNRFLTIDQHLFLTQHQIVSQLHEPGNKTFLIWIANTFKVDKTVFENQLKSQWDNGTHMIFAILANHHRFLQSAKLQNKHRTFIVGLAEGQSQTTAFARFDGETKSTLTDLTLESPGQRGQSSVAELLRGLPPQLEKDSPYFYSEYDSEHEEKISEIPPTFKIQKEAQSQPKLIVNDSTLRQAVFNVRRHVICQNVANTSGKRLLVKVSLNLLQKENRLPSISYEEIESANLPPLNEAENLETCVSNARERLMQSVVEDVSLRDSASLKTLLTGLPVTSFITAKLSPEPTDEAEKEFDATTSALPESLPEEKE